MIANARMYSATPAVKAAWRQLLQWVLARAGLDWAVIDHDPPALLAALWARDDLGLAMMCGLPYAQSAPKPLLVAAPIPSPARYGGRAVYFTDIVVRESSSHRTLEDTFGGVLGYTLADSMSGGVALRHHLAAFARPHGERLYRSAVGGLVNARGVIDALAAGTHRRRPARQLLPRPAAPRRTRTGPPGARGGEHRRDADSATRGHRRAFVIATLGTARSARRGSPRRRTPGGQGTLVAFRICLSRSGGLRRPGRHRRT